MRILHIIDYYGPHGGLNKFLLRQKDALESYGVTHFYLAQTEPPFKVDSEDKEFKVSILSDKPIKDFLDNIMPDIINFHVDLNYEQMEYCLKNYKSIRTIHNNNLFCPYSQFVNGQMCTKLITKQCVKDNCITRDVYNDAISRIEFYKQFNTIVYLAQSIGDKLLSLGFEKEQLVKLPSLIEVPLKLSEPNGNLILFSGRLIEQKGAKYIIEAVAKLKNTDWKLVLAGSGDREYIRGLVTSAVSLGIINKVHFTGHLGVDELKKYLMLTKVFVFSSIGPESYGYSGAEAIMHGIPVVAFNVGGVEEWLESNYTGVTVPVKDVQAMADALEALLNEDDVYQKFKENACRYASQSQIEVQREKVYHFYKCIKDL